MAGPPHIPVDPPVLMGREHGPDRELCILSCERPHDLRPGDALLAREARARQDVRVCRSNRDAAKREPPRKRGVAWEVQVQLVSFGR